MHRASQSPIGMFKNVHVRSDITVEGKINGIKKKPINVEGILIKDGVITRNQDLKEMVTEGQYVLPHKREDEKIELEEHAITFNSLVHFTKKVSGIETIKSIPQCRACLRENVVGLEWDTGTVCMQCLMDVTIHFQGRLSWEEQNGDPIKQLQDKIKKLEERIDYLESHPKEL